MTVRVCNANNSARRQPATIIMITTHRQNHTIDAPIRYPTFSSSFYYSSWSLHCYKLAAANTTNGSYYDWSTTAVVEDWENHGTVTHL